MRRVTCWTLLLGRTAAYNKKSSIAAYAPAPVVWTAQLPEQNATYGKEGVPTIRNTMPIGNGKVGANVFIADDNATLGLLIASQEAYSESGELMKIGWVYFKIVPPPEGTLAEQALDVELATFSANWTGGAKLSVYVDAHDDTFVVELSAPTKIDVIVEARLIRPTAVRGVTPQLDCHEYNISADEALPADALAADAFGWYHRNSDSAYLNRTTRGQRFSPPAGFVDTLAVRQSGAVVFPDRSRHRPGTLKPPGRPLSLSTTGAAHGWRMGVAVVTREAGTPAEWLAAAREAVGRGLPPRAAHEEWWRGFWARSHIVLTNTSDAAQRNVTSQYALQRYVQAVQARGHRFPIKFNGGLFTAQRPPHEEARQWGGLNWWQNLRMAYYNMLASGDAADLLQTLFDGFGGFVPMALARTRAYWPHFEPPSMFLPEYTHPLFGTTHPKSYGCGREEAATRNEEAPSPPAEEAPPPLESPPLPSWYSEDRWNHYNVQNTLDLALLALDAYAHTANRTSLAAILPLIDGSLHFYLQRWADGERDAHGKLVLWPTQAIETWQCPGYPPPQPGDACPSNDMPTLAGLHKVTERALALVPNDMSTAAQRKRWAALRDSVPPLPIGPPPLPADPDADDDDDDAHASSGVLLLRPCDVCPDHTSNEENAGLYAVHPYRLYGIGRPTNLSLAKAAYAHRHRKDDKGWSQNVMDAAMMGLAAEASRLVAARAALGPARGYRFPVFAPHLEDYAPSEDHYAVMSNALTYMLIQTLDDEAQSVLLLPAWPCEWDVDFRVHAPRQTVIAGTLKGGQLVGELEVTPKARRADVRVMACQG